MQEYAHQLEAVVAPYKDLIITAPFLIAGFTSIAGALKGIALAASSAAFIAASVGVERYRSIMRSKPEAARW